MKELEQKISYARMVEFECELCDQRTYSRHGKRTCKSCGNRDATRFIIIHQRNDETVEGMYTNSDLCSG